MTKVTLHRVKRKAGASWVIRWYDSAGRRLGETIGDTRRMTRREAEAERRRRQSRLDCRLDRPDRPARMNLGEFLVWDRAGIADRRPKTLLAHDHAAAHAKTAIGADMPLTRVGRPHVATLKRHLADLGRGAATIDKTIRTLRAAWNRGRQDGLVLDNPWQGASVRWEPRASRVFSPDEIAAMLEAAADGWWRVFLRLLVTTGLRRNEALHLRWSDVDLDTGTVTVCRHDAGRFTVEGREYPLLAWSAKAKASYRTVPLPAATVDALRRWKAKAGRSAYVFLDLERLAAIAAKMEAGKWCENAELANNRLRDFKTLQRRARALLAKRRGVPEAEVQWPVGCLHDLRDTYLTGVKGLPVDVLQRIAGHADIGTTIKFYTGETSRDADAVRAAVEASGLGGSGHARDTRESVVG